MKSDRTLTPSPNETLSCEASPWRGRRRLSGCIFLLGIVVSLAATHFCYGADSTKAVSRQRLAEFRKAYAVTSLSMGEFGVPELISGALSTGSPAGSPVDVTYGFLEANKDVFRMTDPRSELVLVRDEVDSLTHKRHQRFRQQYHGIEVRGGGLTAHFSRKGLLETIGAEWYPDITLPLLPSVSEESALSVFFAEHGIPRLSGPAHSTRLIVLPLQNRYHLAWQINLRDWEDFVDALEGGIILSLSASRRSQPTDKAQPRSTPGAPPVRVG